MAEDHNQPKSPMETKDKTATPKKGGRAPQIVRESVSGLDVRQLLGLGRADTDITPTTEAVEIDLPAAEPSNQHSRKERQANTVAKEFVQDMPDRQVAAPSVERRPDVPSPRNHSSPLPSSPRARPPRPASDTKSVRQESAPELTIDTPLQSYPKSTVNETAIGRHRPIPPVTDPSEISGLRPSIDPLAASTVRAAARRGNEQSTLSPNSVAPDPSIAANAKLEELASLSERTLEDYETFDDFNDTPPQKSRRTPLIILASLLCIGVLAGGVVFAYRQGVKESNNTTLPIIMAETKAAKEEPSNPGGVKIPHQNKLIYDRILGEETDIAEKIVPREEKVATFSQKTTNTTLTKTMPPAKAVVPPPPVAPANPAIGANPIQGKTPVTPRSVKEVAKKELTRKLAEITPPKPVSPPDSLVNGSGIVPKLIVPDASAPPAVVRPEISQPLTESLKLPSKIPGQDSVKPGGNIVQLETEPVTGSPATPSGQQAAVQPSTEKLAIARLVEETVSSDTKPVVDAKVPPVLPRRKPPVPVSEVKRVASTSNSAASAPSTEARSLAGGFVVQIAAFRSQEEALSRYAKLKRRYSGLLKPYTSFIQRADLGDRGVYYRLRLGPIDGKAKATELCRSLLTAGEKDCLVRIR